MVSRLLRVTYNRWWVISCSHSLFPPCSLPNPSFPSPARAKESIKRSRLYISQKQTHFFHLWFGPKRIGNFNFDCAAMIVRCADDDGGGAWVAEQKVLIMSFCSPHFSTLSPSIIIIAFIFTSNVQLNLWSRQHSEISWNSSSNSRMFEGKLYCKGCLSENIETLANCFFLWFLQHLLAVQCEWERRDPRRRWNEFFIVSNSSFSLTRSHTF